MGGIHSDYTSSKEALALGGDDGERVSSSSSGNGWGQQIFSGISGIDSPGLAIISAAAEQVEGSGRAKRTKSGLGVGGLLSSATKTSTFFGDSHSPSILKNKRGGGSISSAVSGATSLLASPSLFGADDDPEALGLNLYSYSSNAAAGVAYAESSPFNSVAMKKRKSAAKFKETQVDRFSIFSDDQADQINLVLPASLSEKLGSGGKGKGGSSSKNKQPKVISDFSGSGKKGKKRSFESPDDGRDQLDLLMKAASSTGTGHSFSSSDDGSKIGSAVKNKKKSKTKDPVSRNPE